MHLHGVACEHRTQRFMLIRPKIIYKNLFFTYLSPSKETGHNDLIEYSGQGVGSGPGSPHVAGGEFKSCRAGQTAGNWLSSALSGIHAALVKFRQVIDDRLLRIADSSIFMDRFRFADYPSGSPDPRKLSFGLGAVPLRGA